MDSGDHYRSGSVGPGGILVQGNDNKIYPAARTLPPRQLPQDVGQFTGREDELGWLRARSQRVLDGDGGLTLVISGMPGAGKSALALHFAHQLARQGLEDVQLYATMRQPDNQLRDPAAILKNFLEALRRREAGGGCVRSERPVPQ
jgi:Mrp family chromosome partitioning ATPase